MIQTINPYATARTAQIMSRYRPIAPKPEPPTTNSAAADDEDAALPTGIRNSPYLSSVWAYLQERPTRTRKRGRSAAFGPPPIKRSRTTCLQGLSHRYSVTNSPAKNLAMHGFTHTGNGLPNFAAMKCGLDAAVTTLAESVAMPLLCCAAGHPVVGSLTHGYSNGLDLNTAAQPVELDLLRTEPAKLSASAISPRVISPRPVRPVGSSITVKCITASTRRFMVVKAAEEVEDALEADQLPAIVSDSNNKVRICNSAYMEMVGQPECCWLQGMRCGACKRIGGEVSLRFVDEVVAAEGFSCLVQIEWEREGNKISVNAACNGVKLACVGKDYQYLWRFHTGDKAANAHN